MSRIQKVHQSYTDPTPLSEGVLAGVPGFYPWRRICFAEMIKDDYMNDVLPMVCGLRGAVTP
ncbi:hypothetical protein [Bacteroides heparinolyticus]|uniref:hypothetical protein n=1 Tax=Prevotella heparinolytica TaxID=28113 RepID=UPI0035A06560